MSRKETKTVKEYADEASRYSSHLTLGTIGVTALFVTAIWLFYTSHILPTWVRGVIMTVVVAVPAFAFWRTFWPRAARGKDIAFLLIVGILAVVMMQPTIQNVWKEYVFSVSPLGLVSVTGNIVLDSFALFTILCIMLAWAIWRTKKRRKGVRY